MNVYTNSIQVQECQTSLEITQSLSFCPQKSSNWTLSGAKYRLNRLRVPQPFHWESRSPVPSSTNNVTNIYWQVWDFDADTDDLCWKCLCWYWCSMLPILMLMPMLTIYFDIADADDLRRQCLFWCCILKMLMLMIYFENADADWTGAGVRLGRRRDDKAVGSGFGQREAEGENPP